jgi:hypothetical protein
MIYFGFCREPLFGAYAGIRLVALRSLAALIL